MARASIFTLDSPRGGVPVVARAVYDLLQHTGHTPTLVYRGTEEVAGLRQRDILRFVLTTRPVRSAALDGMTARSVLAYPMRPRRQYHTLRLARSAVRAPIVAVVSGSSHVGLARALTSLPYVLWVATLYDSELEARAEAGDAWAERLLHHPDWPALEAQERLVHERATVILAASRYTRDRIAARWPHLAGQLRQVHYPVDPARFQSVGDTGDPPYVFLAARIQDRRKNVELLIRACARLRTAYPRLRLVIAGDEPPADVAALVDRLHMRDVTTFAGHVNRDTLVALYQRATLFALPSRQEGLGIAVQEAMACGVPVVATRCGGPESLVEDGKTGFLVPNDDEAALSTAIGEVLADPERRHAMGRAARERCLHLFSSARVESQLRDAFADTFGDTFTSARPRPWPGV